MDRQGCNKNRNTSLLSGFLLLVALLFVATPGHTGSVNQGGSYRPAGKHYYYPDHGFSPYNYQSTGDFANRPMVIPPTVPVLKQPAYFYMQGPKAQQVLPQHVKMVNHLPPSPPRYNPQQAQMPTQQQPAATGAVQPMVSNLPKQNYSLHVGSFLVYSKAGKVAEKIASLGLKTYNKEVAAEGIRYLQLRVGPFASKEEMRQAAVLLDNNKIKNRIAVR
jgi:cell division septation protein DedD